MMKKYISLFIVFVLALSLGGGVVRAEEEKSGPKNQREEFRLKMQAERKAFVEKMQTERATFLAGLKAKKDEWKNASVEHRRDWWGKARRMLGERFEVAVRNLTRAQERVGNVIEKLEEQDKDTDEVVAALDLSKEKLHDAKEKLEEIKDLLPQDSNDDALTPETFEKIKLLAREAKDLLKESREYLRKAVDEVKDLINPEREAEDNDENGEAEDDED